MAPAPEKQDKEEKVIEDRPQVNIAATPSASKDGKKDEALEEGR